MKPNNRRTDWWILSLSLLVIRLALGTIFIAHGAQKVFGAFGGPGIAGVTGMVTALGFHPPLVWSYALALTEFLGGIGILLGLLTRLAGIGIIVVMSVAIATVHGPSGFFLPKGFEFNIALIAMALSLVISGAGMFSLDWLIRRWWKGRG